MKEALITFETAKLSKEKGFNIRTDFKFDRNNNIDRTPSLKYQIRHGSNVLIKPSEFIFAPTQSLLQHWLREVHNCHVEVSYHTPLDYTPATKENIKYAVEVNYYGKDFDKPLTGEEDFGDDHFKTYEEALEIGLQEALKLI